MKAADTTFAEGTGPTVAEKALSLVKGLFDRPDNQQAARRAADIAKTRGINPSQQTIRPGN
ncbi:hypothetical protein ACFLX9_01740 [Chloroflexota bacterium]